MVFGDNLEISIIKEDTWDYEGCHIPIFFSIHIQLSFASMYSRIITIEILLLPIKC